MNLKTLTDHDLTNKKILVRVDLNVPIANGAISDSSRVVGIIPTIKYIQSVGGKTILISHFGRPNGSYFKEYSLIQVVPLLEELLNFPIKFSSEIIGENVKKTVNSLQKGEILLLENTRFCPEEEMNDENFAEKLSSLGDIFCNDAFSASHRAHASTVGLAKFLPNCVGHHMKKEIDTLELVLKNPKKPLTAVVGGAKISSKLSLLLNLIKKVDYLVIGGGMANTFLFAKGIQIGNSLCEKDLKETSLEVMDTAKKNNCEIILPKDVVVASEFKANAKYNIKDLNNLNNEYFFENSLSIIFNAHKFKIGEVGIETIYKDEKSSIPIFLAGMKILPVFFILLFKKNILTAKIQLSINPIIFFSGVIIFLINLILQVQIMWFILLALILTYLLIDIVNFLSK